MDCGQEKESCRQEEGCSQEEGCKEEEEKEVAFAQ
jgi:hypothetical protein